MTGGKIMCDAELCWDKMGMMDVSLCQARRAVYGKMIGTDCV